MSIKTKIHDNGIAELIIDNPPVNALRSDAWGEFADKGAVMPLDLDAELRRWGSAGAARA